MTLKIAFCASTVPSAQEALARLSDRYGPVPEDQADVIVALAAQLVGDGLEQLRIARGQRFGEETGIGHVRLRKGISVTFVS